MKQLLSKYLAIVILITLLPIFFVTSFFHLKNAEQSMLENSHITINQVENMVLQNEANIAILQEELGNEYLTRAKTAAYMLQHHPEHLRDSEEIDKIAKLLHVDEIHVFDQNGVLFAGNMPKYFGLRIDSGGQVSFFLPMLEDKSLELVQGITPNSAESKPMQYVAVWQENKEYIVQIGVVPERVMKEMEKNALSHVLSMVMLDEGSVIFVIDKKSGNIVGATNEKLLNMNMDEVGILSNVTNPENGFWNTIDGVECLCVYEDFEKFYIGVAEEKAYVYKNINYNILLIIFCLLFLGVIAVIAIRKYVDKLVIGDIQRVNEQLNSITAGNLDTEVHIDTTPEMHDLTHNISFMVQSLLNNARYMSYIFEMTGTEAGVYTYNDSSQQVHVTSKIGRLLMLSDDELQRLIADKALFTEKIEEIQKNKLSRTLDNKEVYRLVSPKHNQELYLQIQSVVEPPNYFGIITDRTVIVRERTQLEYERDYDLLTGVLNRRGFYQKIDAILDNISDTECGIIMMLDMDHLKYINDTFGHAGGDAALRTAAKLLLDFAKDMGVVARLSGDEFTVFLRGENQDVLREKIEALQQRCMETDIAMLNQITVPLRFSGGYVFVDIQNKNRQLLLEKADKALYRAKNSGRGILIEYQIALDGLIEE